jgi:hypothetical protein
MRALELTQILGQPHVGFRFEGAHRLVVVEGGILEDLQPQPQPDVRVRPARAGGGRGRDYLDTTAHNCTQLHTTVQNVLSPAAYFISRAGGAGGSGRREGGR